MTILFKVDPDDIDTQIMQRAADCIRDGKLVAFPTETVYGIGANALDAAAVDKIYTAKQRPKSDPLIVHIADLEQLPQVIEQMPEIGMALAQKFWPGPLTLIVTKNPAIPDNVTSGQNTVAVRMPSHPVARQLIQRAGVPVAAPSANLFSRPSSTSGRHVLEDFASGLDMVLDGGDATIGVESTVIDLTAPTPLILRPGGLALEDLQAIIPNLKLKASYAAEDEVVASPGMLLKHYSPRATLLLFDGQDAGRVVERMREQASSLQSQGQRVGLLCTTEQTAAFAGHDWQVFELGGEDELEGISQSLYKGMRWLDEQRVDNILASAPPRRGLGLAIWDRLYRAAEGKVIRVD